MKAATRPQQRPWLQRVTIAGVTMVVLTAFLWGSHSKEHAAIATTDVVTRKRQTFLPFVANARQPCAAIPGANYRALTVFVNPQIPPPENAAADPGYNLSLLGYDVADAPKKLVRYNGASDPTPPPQFYTLFGDQRTPAFVQVYRLHDRDGTPITTFPVTMAALAVTPGEILHAPDSGYDIQYGYDALVVYADEEQVTLNYTRHGNLEGYTVYVNHLCVEPNLLALYRQLNAAGRNELPAVKGGDPIGRARSQAINIVIRDTGSAMDPRSCKDWWVGRCP